MAYPEDALRLPLNPSQLLEVAKASRRRLPCDREIELAADAEAANEYSRVFFGGGQLPEHMHNRVILETSCNTKSIAAKDYFRRIGTPLMPPAPQRCINNEGLL
jgi:hypothetical protein